MAEAQSDFNPDVLQNKKLEDVFLEGWEAFDQLDTSNLSSNSTEFQKIVKNGMKSLEACTYAVSNLDMFSSNEAVEEVATNSLKYMLLPYFLGKLSLRLIRENRLEVLELGQTYFMDFLKRCEEYELTDGPIKTKKAEGDSGAERPTDKMAQLVGAAHDRNSKLVQYRRKKELQEQTNRMKIAVKSKTCEEELQREFFINLIKMSIIDANEELQSIDMEKEVLKMRPTNHSASDRGLKGRPKNQPPPLKPFIITKNAAQKSVFGLGYPSLPIMTVDEFYSQRVEEGIFPDEEKQAQINQQKALAALQDPEELEEAEKEMLENKIENDDPENLARMRRMDEYKDVVRRGDGNRHNRS